MTSELHIIIKVALAQTIGRSTGSIAEETPLLGEFPELDSIGILTLLMELESRLCICMNEADLSADMFATYGTLYKAIENLLLQSNPNMVGL